MTDTKLRIFDAISEIFDEGGLQMVTMSTIAARCNINKGSLFYYFKSKEDMLYQFYDWYLTTNDSRFYQLLNEYVETHDRSVKSFCGLIDLMLSVERDNPSMKDIVSSDILYIASKEADINELLFKKYDRLEAEFIRLVGFYKNCGILNEDRIEANMDDLLFTLCGTLYIEMNGIRLHGNVGTMSRMRLRIKKTFIKEEHWSEIFQATVLPEKSLL